ncbi:1814_t:CDS:2, partial [Racocetra persica]
VCDDLIGEEVAEAPEGRGRRRSENYIQNSSSGHYSVTSSSQNPNIQQHHRSLSGPQNLPLPPLPQQHVPSPHLLHHSHKQHSHSSLIAANWRPSQSQSGQQPPPIPNPPVQITYQNTYSNSKPSSPNNFPNISTSATSSPIKSSQTSTHTT